MKHATLLRLSDWPSELALRYADQQYRGAKVDLKIQEHLTTTSQEQSVMLFVGFIMATDIGLFILAPIKQISHQVYAESMPQTY